MKSNVPANKKKNCGQDRQVEVKQMVFWCCPINRDHQREIARKSRRHVRIRGRDFRNRSIFDRDEPAAGRATSASLIGHSGSSSFRLSTTTVLMSLTGSRFSSDSAPRPFQHGIRRRCGTIYATALALD
jgi:hypothetical protein